MGVGEDRDEVSTERFAWLNRPLLYGSYAVTEVVDRCITFNCRVRRLNVGYSSGADIAHYAEPCEPADPLSVALGERFND